MPILQSQKNERHSNEFERWLKKPKGNQNQLRDNPRSTEKESKNKLRDALNILLQLEIKISFPKKLNTGLLWLEPPVLYHWATTIRQLPALLILYTCMYCTLSGGQMRQQEIQQPPEHCRQNSRVKIDLKENLTSSASLVLGKWNAIL